MKTEKAGYKNPPDDVPLDIQGHGVTNPTATFVNNSADQIAIYKARIDNVRKEVYRQMRAAGYDHVEASLESTRAGAIARREIVDSIQKELATQRRKLAAIRGGS